MNRFRMPSILQILALLSLNAGCTTSPSARTPATSETQLCAQLFSQNSPDAIARRLDAELENPSPVLEALKLKAHHMHLVEFLGQGHSGDVFRVRIGEREFALKLINDPFRRKDPETYEFGETREAILIQKALGELGWAPTVEGIFEKSEIRAWISVHRDVIRAHDTKDRIDRVGLGLLMELTSNQNLKSAKSPIRVSARVKSQLLKDAEAIENVLVELGLQNYDFFDAVITPEGRLKLTDIAWYEKTEKPGKIRGRLRALVEEKTTTD